MFIFLSSCFSCSSGDKEPSKVYALYFPQFHRDAVNDAIWGEGFTDWNNLHKAAKKNRFNQSILHPISTDQEPHLGYYDLLQTSVRARQRELTQQYGIDGFIYHHYWFYHNESSSRPSALSAPLLAFLKDNEPNLPFALNWAMDNWVNAWQGRGHAIHTTSSHHLNQSHQHIFNIQGASPASQHILYEQLCSSATDHEIEEHYQYLRMFFHHKNYIKIEGVPLFSLLRFHPHKCSNVVERLLQLAIEDRFPKPGLHLMGGSTAMALHDTYSYKSGKTVQFLPEYSSHFYYPYLTFPKYQATLPPYCTSQRFPTNFTHPQYPSVMTYFDHTPRRNVHSALVWDRSFAAPLLPAQSFEIDLITIMLYEQCCQSSTIRDKGGKFVVINAWNEWAEGMTLEPSQTFGYSFLDAVLKSKNVVQSLQCDFENYHKYIEKMIPLPTI